MRPRVQLSTTPQHLLSFSASSTSSSTSSPSPLHQRNCKSSLMRLSIAGIITGTEKRKRERECSRLENLPLSRGTLWLHPSSRLNFVVTLELSAFLQSRDGFDVSSEENWNRFWNITLITLWGQWDEKRREEKFFFDTVFQEYNQGKCVLYNFVLIEIIEKVERQGGDFSPRNEDISSRNTLESLVED